MQVYFYLPRPKGHFNSKGCLRPSAPLLPGKRPDLLKLTRALVTFRKNVVASRTSSPAKTPAECVISKDSKSTHLTQA